MTIKIATDFSKTPGHRSPKDGPFSGELFLEKNLKLAYEACLASQDILTVDLDDTAGYATSFLEAAFGGLARAFPIPEVSKRVKIISTSEPYLVDEVAQYIREARDLRKD